MVLHLLSFADRVLREGRKLYEIEIEIHINKF